MRYYLLVMVLLPAMAFAQTNALFLGNSYTAYNSLPDLTADLAASAGYELIVESNTPGGYSFEGHSTNTISQSLIDQGGWDFVVLQEQSQIPSFPIDQVEQECFPFASVLNDQILAADSCTETVFYMTWGRENGDAQNCANWPPVCTYEGMDDLLYERYMIMAEENDALVSPVGRVWRYLRENNPEIDLYNPDGSHPSQAGSYVAACCFFTVFFRADPTLITDDYTLDDATAEVIRTATKTIVFDDMLTWHIGEYDLNAAFTWTAGDEGYVFTAESQMGSAVQYSWNFGFTSSMGAEVEVEFPADGVYPVTLSLDNGCETVSITQEVDVDVVSVDEVALNELIIYPVPSEGVLHIRRPAQMKDRALLVRDATGRIVTEIEGDQVILSPGLYWIEGIRVVVN